MPVNEPTPVGYTTQITPSGTITWPQPGASFSKGVWFVIGFPYKRDYDYTFCEFYADELTARRRAMAKMRATDTEQNYVFDVRFIEFGADLDSVINTTNPDV